MNCEERQTDVVKTQRITVPIRPEENNKGKTVVTADWDLISLLNHWWLQAISVVVLLSSETVTFDINTYFTWIRF